MRKLNDAAMLPGCRVWGLKVLLTAAIATAMTLPPAVAGTDMREITPPTCTSTEKDWTLELGSGVAFSNVRHGQPNQAYTNIPISLTATLKIDEVGLDNYLGGVLRGNTEFFFRGDYQQIVHGPENHVEDFMVGPRYNFVQPGWKLVPYVESGVGIAFADSNPALGGLGQDFNFTFEVGCGARYNFNDSWFMRFGAEYQHVSNAGLSEPEFPNHPIDELGPKLSVGYSF